MGETVIVHVQTGTTVGQFNLQIDEEEGDDVILSIAGASARLEPFYDLDNSVLEGIRVRSVADASTGLELRFVLNEAALAGLEQGDTGLILTFAMDRRAPGMNGRGSDGEYAVGIGDKLEISVFGHPDLTRIVEVHGDGMITYPLVGTFPAAGKSVSEIDRGLTEALTRDYLVDPQVTVDVQEYQSQWVNIIGEIRNPGRYILKRNMRLIDLVAEAGGATKEAGPEIVVTRQSHGEDPPKQMVAALQTLLSSDNQAANFKLRHGDIVTLNPKALFYIRGEVGRPGAYVLEPGMTLLKAISIAGGFGQFANRKEVELLRLTEDERRHRIKINIKAIERGKREDIRLQAHDIVVVPRRIF
jgi:polysaccharide export outer membrane protein